MTIDDEKSIYVGGIPYNCTESQLRQIFELYGFVVAIKIINERDVGGKCYGFVTFKNPRSVIQAIREMDGQTIGGRVVRVNEVKSRGVRGRASHGHEILPHSQRETDSNNSKGGERGSDYNKERQPDHFQEHDGERERRRNRYRDCFQRRDRNKTREMGEWDRRQLHSRKRDLKWDRDDGLNAIQDREYDKVGDHDRRVDNSKEHHTKRLNRNMAWSRG